MASTLPARPRGRKTAPGAVTGSAPTPSRGREAPRRLTISADTGSETLAPGEPLSLSIHGRGGTAFPTGCTFNGAVCPSLGGQQDQQKQEQPSWQQDRRQPPSQDLRSRQWDQQRSGQWDRQRSW